MAVPKFLQPCLASYDLSKLNAKRDKELIITEVLNKGDDQAVKWLGRTYSQEEIKSTVVSPMRGMWTENVLLYWTRIFDIDLPKDTFQKAIINLSP
ncbi:hypothetical protein HYU92_04905 [Candidatus Curtissbacteria bacterium]|nr:hypothetical protein [Candidatus Curtissbacteria bacterium]